MKNRYQPLNTEKEQTLFAPLLGTRLTAGEKELLRQRLHQRIQSLATESGFTRRIFSRNFFQFMPNHRQVAMGTLALFLVSTGISSAAAEQTVPGDALYSMKIHVNEAVVSAFQTTPEKKARWEEALAERRVAEAKRLDSEGKLSDERRVELEGMINTHTTKIHTLRHERENAEVESFDFEKEAPGDTIRVERSHDDKKYHIRSQAKEDPYRKEDEKKTD